MALVRRKKMSKVLDSKIALENRMYVRALEKQNKVSKEKLAVIKDACSDYQVGAFDGLGDFVFVDYILEVIAREE